MTDMDTKRATSKCIATALVCQLCRISCETVVSVANNTANRFLCATIRFSVPFSA